jgi:uncharacterized protein YbjT (DUF2867 family)
MKIVVVGGTGRVGSALIGKLAARGHDVVVAARSTGVNCETGDGLDAALHGAQVVVDVTDAPTSDVGAALDFFTRTTSNLLAAEARARVSHHVALSVVGARRLAHVGGAYCKAKLAQQQIIESSDRAYSIVQATQFFEAIQQIAATSTYGDAVRLAPALIRPMAVDDVAAAVGKVALGAPLNAAIEVAGPDAFRLDRLVRGCLTALGDPRPVVTDAQARFFGAKLTSRMLLPGRGATLASVRLAGWLARRPVAA